MASEPRIPSLNQMLAMVRRWDYFAKTSPDLGRRQAFAECSAELLGWMVDGMADAMEATRPAPPPAPPQTDAPRCVACDGEGGTFQADLWVYCRACRGAPQTDEDGMCPDRREHGRCDHFECIEERRFRVRRSPAPSPAAAPPRAEEVPCGGSRCYLTDDGKKWAHSSKSYSSCAVHREAGNTDLKWTDAAPQPEKKEGTT